VCFALAIYYAKTGKPVLVLNESEDLTFRDYKNAAQADEGLEVEIMLVTSESSGFLKPGRVCYCAATHLMMGYGQDLAASLSKSVVIIDEFDSFIFERQKQDASRLMLIYLSWRLVMFSGSEFQKPHKRFLQEVLKCLYIDLSVKTVKKSSPALERTIAFTSVKDYRDAIAKLVEEKTLKTPVIIIMNKTCDTLSA
jgi:hypothetical protein